MLIGLLITIQSRVITGSFLYVSHKTVQDYQLSLENQNSENKKIEASIKDKENQLIGTLSLRSLPLSMNLGYTKTEEGRLLYAWLHAAAVGHGHLHLHGCFNRNGHWCH